MFKLDEYLKQLEYIVNTDSGSFFIPGLNTVGEFFSSRFEKLGWMVKKVLLDPKTGYLIDICSSEAEYYDVLLLGHMDTVFPEGTAAKRPFRIEDGYAFGPGVADMKAGLLAIYHALYDLSEVAEHLNIRIILNPDEEIFSPYSRSYIADAAAASEYTFVMEPSMIDGSCCIERKGMLKYIFEFSGISIHAGYIFQHKNASAIQELALWVNALMSLADKEKETSVNVGVISGGTAVNVVAGHARAEVEFRMWSRDEKQRIEQTVSRLIENPFTEGTCVRIADKLTIEPMVPTVKTLKFLSRMELIYKANGLPFSVKRCGGVSDGNTAVYHTQVCIDRLGPWGDLNHSDREYIKIDTIEPVVGALRSLLRDIAKNKQPHR